MLAEFGKRKGGAAVLMPTHVSFVDRFGVTEEGNDAGGLTAEMLSLFFREVAAPLYTYCLLFIALFTPHYTPITYSSTHSSLLTTRITYSSPPTLLTPHYVNTYAHRLSHRRRGSSSWPPTATARRRCLGPTRRPRRCASAAA